MGLFGVSWICAVIIWVLSGMVYMVGGFKQPLYWGSMILSVAALLMARVGFMQSATGMLMQTPYSNIKILTSPDGEERHLSINESFSSKVSGDGGYWYIQFIEQHFIKPKDQKMKILVLGAGGFSLGQNDGFHEYDFVDIEKQLKPVAEGYLYGRPLPDNVRFYAEPAVVFLRRQTQQYDLVVLDMYKGRSMIPGHLVTYDFYQLVKAHVKDGGQCILNVIASPIVGDSRYASKMDNTIKYAFPFVERYPLGYEALENIIYVYTAKDHREIYSRESSRPEMDQ